MGRARLKDSSKKDNSMADIFYHAVPTDWRREQKPRLGNRSALDWVIDQYQVSTDKRSGITNDPNRPDDPQYILRLHGQVLTVSLETVKVVKGLPPLEGY